jgi:competence protein ComEA
LAGAGSVLARRHAASAVEVHPAAATPEVGRIDVGGGVAAPGWYPLYAGDTLDDLLTAAGGLLPGSGSSNLSLVVGTENGAQRVNINTAGAWLLGALPGIGETKAQAVIDYRAAHGPFRDTTEIMNVSGIGEGLYDDIRDLITVGE